VTPSIQLLLIRHGHALPTMRGMSDRERVLSPTGVAEAQRLADRFQAHALSVHCAYVSPAPRAFATWQNVAHVFGINASVRNPLYGASPEEIVSILRETPQQCRGAAVVGHNPGLEWLASWLSGRTVTLATGNAVALIGATSWERLALGGGQWELSASFP